MQKIKQEIKKMDEKERQEFLSCDLIERLIRVEQRVSAHFGKPVKYNKTEYYKSLASEEKKRFDNYLRNKGKMRYLLVLIIIPIAFIAFNLQITGNAVMNTLGVNTSFNYVLFGLVSFVALAIFLMINSRLKRRRRLDSHARIIENVLKKRKWGAKKCIPKV